MADDVISLTILLFLEHKIVQEYETWAREGVGGKNITGHWHFILPNKIPAMINIDYMANHVIFRANACSK